MNNVTIFVKPELLADYYFFTEALLLGELEAYTRMNFIIQLINDPLYF
jgi:hypothetical protein